MSVQLSVALKVAAPIWEKMYFNGLSLERAMSNDLSGELKGAVQSVLYCALRQRAKCDIVLPKLVSKKPTATVHSLLSIALGLLINAEEKDFVVVDQTVRAAKANPKTFKAAGFINAVLRNFLRNRAQLTRGFQTNLCARFNAPAWWIQKVRQSFPLQWESILQTQTLRPPLTLRVNVRKIRVDDYVKMLEDAGLSVQVVGEKALIIDPPRPVEEIPGFNQGLCSVQDAGSQLISQFLALDKHAKVLDACAAPGGKTAELLESVDLDVTAMEIDPHRATRIKDTLNRLQLKAKVIVGDGADNKLLNSLGFFDAILLDAPCTASGIVRRHPDIVWSRRPEDIKQLASQQARLLNALWGILPKGKALLYVVCSIFPEEGPEQIKNFLDRHPDASLKCLPGLNESMLRLIPTEHETAPGLPKVHDGFFYALLTKV